VVKSPRVVQRYCPSCKKHNPHEVERVKKRKASELAAGQRRFRRVTAGYRRFPRPKPEGREKPTKRIAVRYRCQKCKKAHQPAVKRSKIFEIKE